MAASEMSNFWTEGKEAQVCEMWQSISTVCTWCLAGLTWNAQQQTIQNTRSKNSNSIRRIAQYTVYAGKSGGMQFPAGRRLPAVKYSADSPLTVPCPLCKLITVLVGGDQLVGLDSISIIPRCQLVMWKSGGKPGKWVTVRENLENLRKTKNQGKLGEYEGVPERNCVWLLDAKQSWRGR